MTQNSELTTAVMQVLTITDRDLGTDSEFLRNSESVPRSPWSLDILVMFSSDNSPFTSGILRFEYEGVMARNVSLKAAPGIERIAHAGGVKGFIARGERA